MLLAKTVREHPKHAQAAIKTVRCPCSITTGASQSVQRPQQMWQGSALTVSHLVALVMEHQLSAHRAIRNKARIFCSPGTVMMCVLWAMWPTLRQESVSAVCQAAIYAVSPIHPIARFVKVNWLCLWVHVWEGVLMAALKRKGSASNLVYLTCHWCISHLWSRRSLSFAWCLLLNLKRKRH